MDSAIGDEHYEGKGRRKGLRAWCDGGTGGLEMGNVHRRESHNDNNTKRQRKNFAEHLSRRAMTSNMVQACMLGISTKEMTIIMLTIMWKRVKCTDNIRGSMEKGEKSGTICRLSNTDLTHDRKSKQRQLAHTGNWNLVLLLITRASHHQYTLPKLTTEGTGPRSPNSNVNKGSCIKCPVTKKKRQTQSPRKQNLKRQPERMATTVQRKRHKKMGPSQ